ncbi:MAG: WG repeat-containing protein [Clostridia bacterium]|nr:WG repeat-containing protein [Clostridia bacterium]
MNLIDENGNSQRSSKKIFILGGTALAILIFIIIVLFAYASVINKNKLSLTVNSQRYDVSKYLLNKEDVLYIGVQDLATMLKNDNYSYISGNKTSESKDECYITNGNESTFFSVGSDLIYKVLETDNQRAYYNIEKPVIKENDKIYMPLSAAKVAFNVAFSHTGNAYEITSIGTIEAAYNKEESKSFTPDTSIVWDTSYQNKILLKDGLVIVKGQKDQLGIAKISAVTDKKKKTTTVTTENVIAPKYKTLLYVEKYGYVIVETEGKKGVVQLKEENGDFTVHTVINPQYDDITPITDSLFLVTKIETSDDSKKTQVKKYGIIKKTDREEDDVIMPMEYDQIGFDLADFPDNGLTNKYILYDTLIPVKKNNLWGFANLKGALVIKLQYSGIGYSENSNANSNVLIIPEVEAIVVKKGEYYGMISKTNRVLVEIALSKVYRDVEDGKTKYLMIYKGVKQDVLKYFEDVVNKTSESTTKTTDTTSNDNENKDTSDDSSKSTDNSKNTKTTNTTKDSENTKNN